MSPTRPMATHALAWLVVLGAAACSEQEAAEQAEAAREMPVTAEYADAIKAHAMKPIVRPSGTGPAVWGPGDLYNLLATGKETNGGFFQFEAIVPAGGGPPPHTHLREDESFYVVSGELELLVGESTYAAKAGDFVFVPRGTIHRFKNVGDTTAVQLVTFVPGGMEDFFEEVFPPVTDRNATPPPVTDELIRRMGEAAPKYGMVLPPPPDGESK